MIEKQRRTQKVELKDYNVMINRRKVFDQPIENDQITYDNI